MSVVLVFVLGFGHHLNDVLTRSLAMRYENVDLIGELRERTRAAHEARAAAETANRAKSQLLAAASHDLRQPLHALGPVCRGAAPRARATANGARWSATSQARPKRSTCSSRSCSICRASRPARWRPERVERRAGAAARAASPPSSRRRRPRAVSRCPSCRTGSRSTATRQLLARIVRNLVANAVRYTRDGRRGRRRAAPGRQASRSTSSTPASASRSSTSAHLRGVLPGATTTPRTGARGAWGSASRSCAGWPTCSARDRAVVATSGRGSRFASSRRAPHDAVERALRQRVAASPRARRGRDALRRRARRGRRRRSARPSTRCARCSPRGAPRSPAAATQRRCSPHAASSGAIRTSIVADLRLGQRRMRRRCRGAAARRARHRGAGADRLRRHRAAVAERRVRDAGLAMMQKPVRRGQAGGGGRARCSSLRSRRLTR